MAVEAAQHRQVPGGQCFAVMREESDYFTVLYVKIPDGCRAADRRAGNFVRSDRTPLSDQDKSNRTVAMRLRRTGKSTLLKVSFPDAPFFNLLHTDVYFRLQSDPSRLRQEIQALAGDSS